MLLQSHRIKAGRSTISESPWRKPAGDLKRSSSFPGPLQSIPNYYKSYYNLADLYLVSDQPETALPLLQTAIRLNPNFTEAYVSIGAALMRGGQFNEVTNIPGAEPRPCREISRSPFLPRLLPMLFWGTGRQPCGSWRSFPSLMRPMQQTWQVCWG